MADMNVPNLGSLSSGEICVGFLILLAMFSVVPSLGYSVSDPSFGFGITSIVLCLAAIAVAILVTGRRISAQK